MSDLTIILRTCDRVEKFSTHNGLPRPFGLKPDIIKKCFNSLIDSIEHAKEQGIDIDFTIIDDNSSDEMREYLCTHRPTTRYGVNMFRDFQGTGNGASLKACYEFARDAHSDHIFFIEDDYLFNKTAIFECFDIAKRGALTFAKDVCVHPVDYPDRYTRQIYPSYVMLGRKRHWRTIKETTGTFMITKAILAEQWNNYMAFADIGIKPGVNEGNTINVVYEKYPCLSPLPTLAEHYQENFTLSPYSSHAIPEKKDGTEANEDSSSESKSNDN